MKSMLARIPPSARRSCFWLRTLASSHPSGVLILTWLPTWPASAIEGSPSAMHSLSRCRSSAICDPEPAISSTMPIGSSALSTLAAFAGPRLSATAPGSSAGLKVWNCFGISFMQHRPDVLVAAGLSETGLRSRQNGANSGSHQREDPPGEPPHQQRQADREQPVEQRRFLGVLGDEAF